MTTFLIVIGIVAWMAIGFSYHMFLQAILKNDEKTYHYEMIKQSPFMCVMFGPIDLLLAIIVKTLGLFNWFFRKMFGINGSK